MGDYAECSLYCVRCGEFRLHRQERANAVVGVLLAIFTCLIGFLIWLLVEVMKRRPWRCSVCGLEWDERLVRDAYLAKHPEEAERLNAEKAQEAAERLARAEAAATPEALATSEAERRATIKLLKILAFVFLTVLILAAGGLWYWSYAPPYHRP